MVQHEQVDLLAGFRGVLSTVQLGNQLKPGQTVWLVLFFFNSALMQTELHLFSSLLYMHSQNTQILIMKT